MNNNEKCLLLQLILEDLRGNWADSVSKRQTKAISLAKELGYEELAKRIEYWDETDGRYFRDEYPYGYIDMEKLHGLSKTFKDKSEEFKKEALLYLTYPEYRFEDWEE